MLLKVLVICVMVCAASGSASSETPKIEYTLSIPQPQTHLFQIEVDIQGLDEPEIDLSLPVWSTGYYQILDFPGRVMQFKAQGGQGAALKWEKLDKNTWRVQTDGTGSVLAEYMVYGRVPSNLQSFVNARTGHILGSSLFVFADGREGIPVSLKLNLPRDWKVSNGALPVEGDSTRFRFSSYHELADTPMIIGKHSEYTYDVGGIPHVVAIEGESDLNHQEFVEATRKMAEAANRFFGGLPYEKYCFIVFMSRQVLGGLEHANGTTMGRPPWGFSKDPRRMASLIGLTAHEYFHTWNVKRIQPHVFKPYNYDRETTTGFLWFSEGVTSYYTDQLLLRSGLSTPEKALENLARLITQTRNTPGRLYTSAFDSSFNTWLNPWVDENAVNARISYYPKGEIAALIIDLEIMKRTGAAKSLDDVILTMWKEYRDRDAGFDTEEVRELCEQAAGGSLDAVFADYVYGVKEVPFEEYLEIAGYDLVKDTDRMIIEQKGAFLGARYADQQGKVMVTNVLRDTEAWRDGLNTADEIIAFDGTRIHSTEDLDLQLELRKPGDEVILWVGRDGRVEEISVTMEEHDVPIYKIVEAANPTAAQLEDPEEVAREGRLLIEQSLRALTGNRRPP